MNYLNLKDPIRTDMEKILGTIIMYIPAILIWPMVKNTKKN